MRTEHIRPKVTVGLVLVYLLAPWASRAQSNLATTTRTTPVQTGEVAPDFALEDQHGNAVTLSKEVKNGPVVIVFYRGYW